MNVTQENNRELARRIEAPRLNDRAVELLTRLLFRQDDVGRVADVVVVFGTRLFVPVAAETVRQVLAEGASRRVIVAGGSPRYADSRQRSETECDEILNAVRTADFPDVTFVAERTSANTMENVTFAVRDCGLAEARSIAFVCANAHAGRCYLTLRKYVPQAELIQRAYVPMAGAINLRATDWHLSDDGRDLVWAEFLRIRTYGERGDIAYDEVAEIVAAIMAEVQ